MTGSGLFDKETLDRLLHKFLVELSDSGVKGAALVPRNILEAHQETSEKNARRLAD